MSDEPDPRRRFALEVVGRLRAAGHQALWAGGCVRDLLLGLDPADYDVATSARPEQVVALFRRTVPVGISFGVVRVLGPRGAGEVEVATFRSDGAYVDGRRPTAVTFSSPEADAARRDFTINGMFLDPIEGGILDFVGGRADLEARLLRAIGDPAARFAEDKLRLIRAVRFAARFGLTIEPATAAAIRGMADQLPVVAPERIAQELRRMLVHPSRATGMAMAAELGLLGQALPVVRSLLDDPGKGDLWEETLGALRSLPAGSSFPLALAALLHRSNLGSSVAAVHASARDLKLSNAERDRAAWLLDHLPDLPHALEGKPNRRKRLLAREGAEELIALARATSGMPTTAIDSIERYLRDQPEGPLAPPPLLDGNDLRDAGLTPGPRFKQLLDAAYDAQLDNLIHTREEALAWARRHIQPAGSE